MGVTMRKDGSYMGQFQYNGERFTVYGKTAKETRDKLENMRYEAKHGTLCRPESVTMNKWFDTWMETYKKNSVKPLTYNRYLDSYRLFIAPKLGKRKISDIRPQAIQRLVNDIFNDGYSQSQIRIVFVILKGMLGQAVKNQLIIVNPTDAVTLPRRKQEKREERRVMSLKEQQMFLKYAEGSVYYSFYQIALETGMRINEICGLQWSDIDFSKKEIHVTGTLSYIRGQGRIKGTPKSQTGDRVIPMLPGVEEILKSNRIQQKKNRLRLGKDYKIEPGLPDLVLTYPEGGAFWDVAIREDINKTVRRINEDGIQFEKITPHTFRHTFATRCCERGMTPKVLQEILGHSTMAMTMDLYSHVLPDTKQEEMKKIANLF